MIFTLVYMVAILLPGFLITRLFKINSQIILFSVSFSLVYFVGLLFIAIAIKFSVSSFYLLYAVGLALLISFNFISQNRVIWLTNYQLAGYVIVVVFSVLYLFFVGLYDELPSDIYKHLENFKNVSTKIGTAAAL